MAQEEEKKAKQDIFLARPHAKPQSNVLTVFHYAPRTLKSFMMPKI
jgi:hypothetical protein